ncbi:hypothetical protein CN270_12010 [Priestia megaterium]|uniref:DUF3967 domain-containing protein n=1 Tax=Priestia megaterium TaxID=1404 RepID=UPI000BF3F0B7|nr:DUF3967 domain-containing protein [Priestia megaterium]PFE33654.1 hypothetical protein CN270_12010 [Priestia megaterium]
MINNERAYWTHEVAEQVEIGESTLRKWCLELEKNGYSFTKGEQESRAFLKQDIDVLNYMKSEIRGKKKSIKDGAIIAVNKGRTGGVLVKQEQPQAPLVHQEQLTPMFTLADVRNIVREELQERDKARESERDKMLMEFMRELQDVKKMIAASQEDKKKRWYEFWKQ